MGLGGGAGVLQDAAGFDAHRRAVGVDGFHLSHSFETEGDGAIGSRTVHQAGPTAPRHDGRPRGVREPHHRGDLFGRVRTKHRPGRPEPRPRTKGAIGRRGAKRHVIAAQQPDESLKEVVHRRSVARVRPRGP